MENKTMTFDLDSEIRQNLGDTGGGPTRDLAHISYLPNAGGIVALRSKHEFRPRGKRAALLVELENIKLQSLRFQRT